MSVEAGTDLEGEDGVSIGLAQVDEAEFGFNEVARVGDEVGE